MITTVRQTIDRYRMLAEGDRILVGLSGGPDSVAMLDVLDRLSRSWRLRIHAVYVNHGLRRRAAREEEQFCRSLCDSRNVPFRVARIRISDAEKKRRGVEDAARRLRHQALEETADEIGCNRIALGHHYDDRAETVLFRIVRGTGLDGLRGIPPVRRRIIRPLFDVRREQILAYLEKYHLDYCLDSSNRSPQFSRNYLRLRVLPQLKERLNGNVERALVTLSETATADVAVLERLTRRAVAKTLKVTPGEKFQLDLKTLRSYDTAICRRVLRYCLAAFSGREYAPDQAVVQRLERLLDGSADAVDIPGQARVAVVGRHLVWHRKQKLCFDLPLHEAKNNRVPGMRYSLSYRQESGRPGTIRTRRGARRVVIDAGAVAGSLRARTIRPGDRFRPLGLKGTKKVGDFLTDRKVPAVLRDEVVAVCDDKGIVWLVGLEIADRVKVVSSTRKVITLGCTQHRSRSLA